MDRDELMGKLQGFKKACYDKGYIDGELYLDEAYPGIVPTSFIVSMIAKKQWLDTTNSGDGLDQLIDILWETTTPETRKNIFTLSFLTLDEMVNSDRQSDREKAATNPDLTSEQIEKLFHDKKPSVRYKIINHIKTALLTEQQIRHVFETDDKDIIALLLKRIHEDKDIEKLIFANKDLKIIFLGKKVAA